MKIKLELPPVPSAEDRLFLTAEDWWNNACLNFLSDGWSLYAIGYKDAADILVSQVEQKKSHQDTLMYPIIFLYRQYLELEIKDLIRDARKLLNINEPFPQIHAIDRLWGICSDLLNQVSPGDSEDAIRHIKRLIDEFCIVDPMATAFRYPEDRQGKPSLPEMSAVNLRNIKEVIGKISVILDGAGAMIHEYRSIKMDMYSGL